MLKQSTVVQYFSVHYNAQGEGEEGFVCDCLTLLSNLALVVQAMDSSVLNIVLFSVVQLFRIQNHIS